MFKQMIAQDRHHIFYHGNNSVRIRRGHEFEDAFDALYGKDMKNRLKVVFVNQYGF